MNRIQHPSNNAVRGAPQGSTIEQCRAASVTLVEYSTGDTGCITFWKPTAEELAMLNQGWAVSVEYLGLSMPPTKVLVDSPVTLDRSTVKDL